MEKGELDDILGDIFPLLIRQNILKCLCILMEKELILVRSVIVSPTLDWNGVHVFEDILMTRRKYKFLVEGIKSRAAKNAEEFCVYVGYDFEIPYKNIAIETNRDMDRGRILKIWSDENTARINAFKLLYEQNYYETGIEIISHGSARLITYMLDWWELEERDKYEII